jgi:hypothetical protein
MWTGFIWLRIANFEHGEKDSGSIKGEELD